MSRAVQRRPPPGPALVGLNLNNLNAMPVVWFNSSARPPGRRSNLATWQSSSLRLQVALLSVSDLRLEGRQPLNRNSVIPSPHWQAPGKWRG
jgi:hypothetical protein